MGYFVLLPGLKRVFMDLFNNLKHALPSGLGGVIFDCDGVLLDSRDSNTAYYNLVRKFFHLPPMTPEQEYFVHIHTSLQSLHHVVPAPFLPRLDEAIASIDYMQDLTPHIHLESGVCELLQGLHEAGVKLAVHTNRSVLTVPLLDYFGLSKYFSPMISAATHKPKPDPEGIFVILSEWQMPPERVLFVGDSMLDQQASSAAGVGLLAYKNPDLSAVAAIDDFAALLPHLLRLAA